MKIYLCLLILIFSACSVPGQAKIEPKVPGKLAGATPSPLVQSTNNLGLASGALFASWGEGKQPFKIRLLDPATGQNIPGFEPISLAPMNVTAFRLAPDGKKLAIIETHGEACEAYAGGTACRGNADVLHLINIPSHLEVKANLPDGGWVELLTFSPTANYLALVKNAPKSSSLIILDTATGQFVGQQVLQFRPTLLNYTQDGQYLVVYGQPLGSSPGISKPGVPRVMLVDAAGLEVQWDQQLEDIVSGDWCSENCNFSHEKVLFVNWRPAVVPSQIGRQLYIVHADKDRLTRVDFDTRTVKSTEIHTAQSWLERLLTLTAGVAKAKGNYSGVTKEAAFSQDGKQLFVATGTTNPIPGAEGDQETVETRLELQVLDVQGDQRVATQQIDIPGRWVSINQVMETPDGAFVVLNGWSDGNYWAEVREAKGLKLVAHLDGWELLFTRRMDGQPILVGNKWQDGKLVESTLFNSQTFEAGKAWKVDSNFTGWLNP